MLIEVGHDGGVDVGHASDGSPAYVQVDGHYITQVNVPDDNQDGHRANAVAIASALRVYHLGSEPKVAWLSCPDDVLRLFLEAELGLGQLPGNPILDWVPKQPVETEVVEEAVSSIPAPAPAEETPAPVEAKVVKKATTTRRRKPVKKAEEAIDED